MSLVFNYRNLVSSSIRSSCWLRVCMYFWSLVRISFEYFRSMSFFRILDWNSVSCFESYSIVFCFTYPYIFECFSILCLMVSFFYSIRWSMKFSTKFWSIDASWSEERSLMSNESCWSFSGWSNPTKLSIDLLMSWGSSWEEFLETEKESEASFFCVTLSSTGSYCSMNSLVSFLRRVFLVFR